MGIGAATVSRREGLFAATLVLAAGLALSSYLLGVLLDPAAAGAFAGGLVVMGLLAFVPDDRRLLAGVVAGVGVGLAGVAVPRFVARLARAGDAVWLSVALSGVALLLTVAVLRLTAFRGRGPDAA